MCKVEINDEFSIKIYITDLRTLPTFKITINSHLQMDINNTPTITKPTNQYSINFTSTNQHEIPFIYPS